MKTVPVRNALPAVPLCCTAGFIPPRPPGAGQRRRRDRLKPGVQRSETPGHGCKQYSQPLTRGAENGALEVTLIERQTLRAQDHFEFLNKRNASMMFFLSFDVTAHLRRLRLTHRERTISFLPRESRGLWKRPRNPAGRIRLQFTDKLRKCLVLSQLRQDVDMVRRPVNNYRDPVFRADSPADVLMNSWTDCSGHPRLATLCRKDDVIEEIAIGGTHRNAPFRRPSSGASVSLHITPGVPLRSTPRFIPPHPSGALLSDDTPGVPVRSTPGCIPSHPSGVLIFSDDILGVPVRSTRGFIPPHPPGALNPRTAGSVLRVRFDLQRQRRRRGGVEPGAERSGAPGNRGINIIKPLTRGGGERGPDLGVGALK